MSASAFVLPREIRANDGSDEITVWCDCCLERTIPGRWGCCMFCDTPLTDEAKEREAETGTKRDTLDELEVRRTAERVEQATRAREAAPVIRIPRRRVRRQRGKPGHRALTDEQIISRIQLWAEVTGKPPAQADWNPTKLKQRAATARGHIERHLKLLALYEVGDFPAQTTVRKRFGSMNAAIVQAGYSPRAPGRQPTTGAGIGKKPRIGRPALREYMADVQAHLDGDEVQLKASLYTLALSAFWLADRIQGVEAPDVHHGDPLAGSHSPTPQEPPKVAKDLEIPDR